MQTIPISEAETDFRDLLQKVEHGETVLIERDGRPIVCMSPSFQGEAQINSEKVRQAIAGMEKIRKRTKPVSLEEIFSSRDEGRR
jgi:antitoxin (DNA-binding transcriptional repressor) of toxin-antitoxin stability system